MSAAKDLHRLMKNIGAQTDGQAIVDGVDWEDGRVDSFKITLRPNSGYFRGGAFEFQVYLGKKYPNATPPIVRCFTDILHPNIYTCDGNESDCSPSTNVCLNLLQRGTWNPKLGLESVVLGLLFLLNNPNFESPFGAYNIEFDDEHFEDMVFHYMRAEEVAGKYFDIQFFSNVDGQTDIPYGGRYGTEIVQTEYDVTRTNTRCSTEENQTLDSLAQQKSCESLTKHENLTGLTNQERLRKHLLNSISCQNQASAAMNKDAKDTCGMKLMTVNHEIVLVNK